MNFAGDTISWLWIIFLVYWLISSRSVKQTQEKVGGIGGWWHWALIIIAFLVMQSTQIYPLNIVFLSPNMTIETLSIVFAGIGLLIAIMARKTLADNWSGSVTFKKDHTLITNGVYHYMRHPIYTGVLLMFIASAMLYGTIGAIIGFIIIFVTFWLKLRQEEMLMIKHFPKEYPKYKSSVKALIPFVI